MNASKEDYAKAMGYDAGINKPNTTNCHFSLFATKERMEAWSLGKARAERERTTVPSIRTVPALAKKE